MAQSANLQLHESTWEVPLKKVVLSYLGMELPSMSQASKCDDNKTNLAATFHSQALKCFDDYPTSHKSQFPTRITIHLLVRIPLHMMLPPCGKSFH